MEENNRQEDDDLTDSQIDLEKIRESRLQRTREAMMEFDRDIAISVIPENIPNNGSSAVEYAAICIQKHFRGYLGRKQYREKLLDQYEKDEEERQKKQMEQTEEAEILVEMARLQLEAEEDNTIQRNRQRMLNVYATRIQRAWRHYVANRPTQHTHHSGSFEEQVYQATGLNVTDIITGSSTLKNTTADQLETEPSDQHENPSTLHDSDTHNQACSSEAVAEDTEEISSSPTAQVLQDITESNPTVDDSNESNLVVEDVGKSSPASVDTIQEIHQEDAATNDTTQVQESTPNDDDMQEKELTPNDDETQERESKSNDDMQEKDSRTDDKVDETHTKVSDKAVTQKGDKKVRFNLQDSEDKEDSTVTQNIVTSNNELTLSDEEKKSGSEFFSSGEISFTMPAEQVKQLGYTQLRELKCSLETKLGSLSDQLITELQSRERLLAHKDFLMEKIQNLTKLVQNQHKLNQKHRKRIKSSGQ